MIKTFIFITTIDTFQILKDDENAFEFFKRNIVLFGISKKSKNLNISSLERHSTICGMRFIELSESDYIEWMINYENKVSIINPNKICIVCSSKLPKNISDYMNTIILNGIQYNTPKSAELLLKFIKIHYNKFKNNTFRLGLMLH